MRILLTGASGFIGAALAPALADAGAEVHGFSRDVARIDPALPLAAVHRGDLLTGEGLEEALEGIEVAYYLVHSMEPSSGSDFAERDRRAAGHFGAAAAAAGVSRIIYLGGPVPRDRPVSAHLRSRLEVEEILRRHVPGSVALRASIVIGARSRSFLFLVRLVERMRVVPMPAWGRFRTQPIDERDIVAYLVRTASAAGVEGMALDVAGRETLTFTEMIERIAGLMLVARPALHLPFNLTSVAGPIAARIAGEQLELIAPLMSNLDGDILVDDRLARELLGVRLHSFDAAVERALRELEQRERVRAR